MRSALLWKDYDSLSSKANTSIIPPLLTLWDQPCFERITTIHTPTVYTVGVCALWDQPCFVPKGCLRQKDYDLINGLDSLLNKSLTTSLGDQPCFVPKGCLRQKDYDVIPFVQINRKAPQINFMRSALLWKDYDITIIVELSLSSTTLWDQPCFERITTGVLSIPWG